MGESTATGASRTLSVRRRIILGRQRDVARAERALIVRWIGVRGRKNSGLVTPVAPSPVRTDNVIALSWSDTFGRPTAKHATSGDTPAVILTLSRSSGTATAEAGAAVRHA